MGRIRVERLRYYNVLCEVEAVWAIGGRGTASDVVYGEARFLNSLLRHWLEHRRYNPLTVSSQAGGQTSKHFIHK